MIRNRRAYQLIQCRTHSRLLAGGIGRIAGGIASSRERKQKQKEIGRTA